MQSYEQSLENLLNQTPIWQNYERIAISNANERILSQDIIAQFDLPSFDTAAMDGYAIKFDDLKEGERLKIIGILPAGSENKFNIKKGECVKTFTGALMSGESDTLIPIENVSVQNDEITINLPVNLGFAVRKIGESYKKGDLLLKKGTKIGFGELTLLAELGICFVNVLTRPKIAVLSIGSELLDIGENRSNLSQIYTSNNIAIANIISNLGCESVILPIIEDDFEKLENTINQALSAYDAVITTGGVSVGDFDFMKQIARSGEIIVDKAAIKPGRHIKIAKFNNKFLFALPGFSYSAVVTCLLYFREFATKMLWQKSDFKFKAILSEDYSKKSNLQEFSAANLINENGVLKITTKGKKKGSSAISTNLLGNAVLLICPQNQNELKSGEIVEYLKLC